MPELAVSGHLPDAAEHLAERLARALDLAARRRVAHHREQHRREPQGDARHRPECAAPADGVGRRRERRRREQHPRPAHDIDHRAQLREPLRRIPPGDRHQHPHQPRRAADPDEGAPGDQAGGPLRGREHRRARRGDHEQPGHRAPGTEPVEQDPGRDLHDAEREEERAGDHPHRLGGDGERAHQLRRDDRVRDPEELARHERGTEHREHAGGDPGPVGSRRCAVHRVSGSDVRGCRVRGAEPGLTPAPKRSFNRAARTRSRWPGG